MEEEPINIHSRLLFSIRVRINHQDAVTVRDRYEVHPSPLRCPNKEFSVVIARWASLWSQQRLHGHAASSSLPCKCQQNVVEV